MRETEILLEVDNDQLRKLRIDGRGRVTIPKDFRDRYELVQGDCVELALIDVDTDGYTCDECGRIYELPEVLVLNRDSEEERVVCADCSTPDDRII